MAQGRYSDVEVKAGVFLAFCVALFVGMVLVYGKVPRIFRQQQSVQVLFSSVSNLRPDALVVYNGVDVGRVKSMEIVHLDRNLLDQVVPLTKADLEHLPLDDKVQKDLRLTPDAEFEGRVKEALLEKTMIKLTLEVQQENKRYRTGDKVRISATVLGDSSIEIVSGSGPPLDANDKTYLIGHAGDFFTNLSRSMDSVREVLGTVTDVVDVEARGSFKRGASRLDPILDSVARLGEVAEARSRVTNEKLAGLDMDAASRAMGDLFLQADPDRERLYNRIEEARKDVDARLAALMEEVDAAETELKALASEARDHVAEARQRAEPDIARLKQNFLELTGRASRLSGRVGSLMYWAEQLQVQSIGEFDRVAADLKAGVDNLNSPELKYIKGKIDKMWGAKAEGEYEFYTALETHRALERAARAPRYALTALAEVRPLIPNPAQEGQAVTRTEIDRAMARLAKLQEALDLLRDGAAETMRLPFTGNGQHGVPYPRKRAGWAEYPETR